MQYNPADLENVRILKRGLLHIHYYQNSCESPNNGLAQPDEGLHCEATNFPTQQTCETRLER